jgi:hypothetical protein
MGEIHLDFLNFNTIILTLLILLIGGYLYYEIYKVNITLEDINLRLNYCMNNDTGKSFVNDGGSSIPNNDAYGDAVDIRDSVDIRDDVDTVDTVDIRDDVDIRDIRDIKRQMDYDDSEDRSDSGEDRSDSDRDRSDSEDDNDDNDNNDISQEEIEKDYGKAQFDNETNNASIDDILSDKNIITDNSLSDILNVDNDLSNIDEFMMSIKNSEPKKEYNEMTVTELKKVLSDMSLPVSGNKTKLIERILENKK